MYFNVLALVGVLGIGSRLLLGCYGTGPIELVLRFRGCLDAIFFEVKWCKVSESGVHAQFSTIYIAWM